MTVILGTLPMLMDGSALWEGTLDRIVFSAFFFDDLELRVIL